MIKHFQHAEALPHNRGNTVKLRMRFPKSETFLHVYMFTNVQLKKLLVLYYSQQEKIKDSIEGNISLSPKPMLYWKPRLLSEFLEREAMSQNTIFQRKPALIYFDDYVLSSYFVPLLKLLWIFNDIQYSLALANAKSQRTKY